MIKHNFGTDAMAKWLDTRNKLVAACGRDGWTYGQGFMPECLVSPFDGALRTASAGGSQSASENVVGVSVS